MPESKKIIERKYHLFDARKEALGRLATKAAVILRGKNKASFSPNVDEGDFVVVVNSDKTLISGNKKSGKIYHRFSGYPGGISSAKLGDRLDKNSASVIRDAVYGMLPKNKLRDKMIKRLLIYKNEEHKHKIDVNHE